MSKSKMDKHNPVSNTVAGINTPSDQSSRTGTDSVNEFVGQVMDNIAEDLGGKPVTSKSSNQ